MSEPSRGRFLSCLLSVLPLDGTDQIELESKTVRDNPTRSHNHAQKIGKLNK